MEKPAATGSGNGACAGMDIPPAKPRFGYGVGILAALGIHALILFGWRMQKFEKAEFGMDAADSSVEVSLVAAPPDEDKVEPVKDVVAPEPEVVPPPVEPTPVPETPPPLEKPPEMTRPASTPVPVEIPKPATPPQKLPPKIKPVARKPRNSGDGSAVHPGNDATTMSASSGALSAKPGYLRNPNPAYPEQARAAGQQGVVHLRVKVSAQGTVISVEVARSSGFPLLDERARSTVLESWIFKPAQLNGNAVSSEVTIPIRFTLD